MKHKLFTALILGALLSTGTVSTFAQSTTIGSNGGAVIPGTKNRVQPNADAGSPASEPETSLSQRSAANPATRESDVPNQVATLLPYAAVLGIFLIGGLYWFVFRKPNTPEGEAATTGTNPTKTS